MDASYITAQLRASFPGRISLLSRSSLLHRLRASSIGRALSERNYRLFTIGSTIGLIGQWTQRMGIGWLTWELTHSGTWLGLMAFADLFPTVVLTPFAGVLADRLDRRRMITVTQSLAMVQAVVLAALTLMNLIEVWSLFLLALFLGIVMSFNVAARLALTTGMSRRENLPTAIGINSAVFNVARFLGPAIGGYIIVSWGIGIAFVVNAVSFFATLVALMMMRNLHPDELAGRKAGVFSQIGEGMSYAWQHRGIGPVLVVSSAVALGVKPFMELLPGIADEVYNGGAKALSELTAATGLGALVTALWLAQRGRLRGLTLIVIASTVVSGAAVLAFSASHIYWLGLLCAFVAGGAMTISGAGTQTLMQNAVEGAVRGRVMSLFGLIFRGAPALGALVLGTLSEVTGLQFALAIGGAGSVIVGLLYWRVRHVAGRALERDKTAQNAQKEPVKT